ncbi:MAG: class I SAM-dependent methyltransferase [Thermodesulfobacteriota bacterium]
MPEIRSKYIYALHYNWLTCLYDPLVKWATREITFKKALRAQAKIQPGHRILDLGCGTGTLCITIMETSPPALLIGCDGDKKVLRIARAKPAPGEAKLSWHCALAYELPYATEVFNHVFSSFLFHHLTKANKLKTLSEIWRVLRPGGELHLADWGKPQNWLMRLSFLIIQILDGFQTTADNRRGFLVNYLQEAGFVCLKEVKKYNTLLGTLSLYKAQKPAN